MNGSHAPKKISEIIEKFKENGCRITEQRKIIIRTIIDNSNCSCKEIFYLASMSDKKISQATVYRTIRTLEEMNCLSRQSFILSKEN